MCSVTQGRSAHRKIILIAIAMIALCVSVIPRAQAWGNGGYSADPLNPDYGTHDWIAEMALTIQTKDVTFLTTTYHAKFLLGTEAPDNPAYIGDSTNHHFYFYANGEVQDDKSAVRASQMYQVALGYLVVGDLENAAYYIGAMTHYIADVGVFAHTMGSGTDWGSETHHLDYEQEVEARYSSWGIGGLMLGDEDTYNATRALAWTVTFGGGHYGQVLGNTYMDDHYDWTWASFEVSAMFSVSQTIETVAEVINHLLVEAQTPIPEFGSPILISLVVLGVIAVAVVRAMRKSPL